MTSYIFTLPEKQSITFSSSSNEPEKTVQHSLKHDLLSISCAIHRCKKASQPIINSSFGSHELMTPESQDAVEPQDKAKAQEIKDYYTRKLMMLALVKEYFSKFRTDLASYLAGRTALTADDLGMIYKLPEFYEYDCQFDLIRQQLVFPEFETAAPFTGQVKLVGRGGLSRKTRRGSIFQFIFEGEVLTGSKIQKVPCMITSSSKESSAPILRFATENNYEITISGSFMVRTVDRNCFYVPSNWQVLSMEKA